MSSTKIVWATADDVATIRQIAVDSWWPAYGGYLPHGQIDLMLERQYAEVVLKRQLDEGHCFLLAYLGEAPVGFAGLREMTANGTPTIRIEKLYILPHEQGKGIGRLLLEKVDQYAQRQCACCVELNVNRNNPAKRFYEKLGFAVVREVDIPYHGYVLNDYVMQKPVGC